MKELALKYGCNPNQKPARVFMEEGELPIEVLSGRPGYINLLDALNSWQLVKGAEAGYGPPCRSFVQARQSRGSSHRTAAGRDAEENLLRR